MSHSKPNKAIADTKKFYDKNYSIWTTQKTNAFYHENNFKKINQLWPEKGTIIDIGCAAAIHVPLFLGIGRKVKYYGIDISKSFLKIASQRYPQLSFAEGDIADITTLPKKKFSGFWFNSTLHHIPPELWDQVFDNVETLCKKGSYGYISIPTGPPGEYKDDTRQVTILPNAEQRAYLKKRNWKIKHSGVMDGYNNKAIWNWYIVQLP